MLCSREKIIAGVRLTCFMDKLQNTVDALALQDNITSSFIVVKTARSRSQQSVTQDSDYIASAYTVAQDSHNNQV